MSNSMQRSVIKHGKNNTKTRRHHGPLSIFIQYSTGLLSCFAFNAFAQIVNVSTHAQLQAAIAVAQPGDEIVIKKSVSLLTDKLLESKPVPFSPDRTTRAYFQIKDVSGTAEKPITLRGESNKSSEFPTLLGQGVLNQKYAFHLVNSNYWVIKNIRVSTEEKGIMLDQSNHNTFDNIEITNIGHEAIHFRSSSSHNALINCHIMNTGMNTAKAGFGEGVYVGYHNGHKKSPQDNSNHNLIGGCTFGPNITAEAIDIKAGTFGTIIEKNIFSGAGGGTKVKPAANSFIDIKGSDVTVRHNTLNLDGSEYINHLLRSADEHKRSNIHHNQLNLKPEFAMYEAAKATIYTYKNTRVDGGSATATKSKKKQVHIRIGEIDKALSSKTPEVKSYTGFNFN